MMNHEQIEEFLPEIASGPSSGTELPVGVEQHVAGCGRCQEWLETYWLVETGLREETLRGKQRSTHLSSLQLAEAAIQTDNDPILQAHLACCRQCRSELELARSALGQLAQPSDSHDTSTRLSPAVALAAAGLVAVLGLTLWVGRPATGDAADYLLSNHSLTGREVFAADSSITVLDTEVSDGADVTLRAGKTVSIGDGFSVGSEANFSIELTSENSS